MQSTGWGFGGQILIGPISSKKGDKGEATGEKVPTQGWDKWEGRRKAKNMEFLVSTMSNQNLSMTLLGEWVRMSGKIEI